MENSQVIWLLVMGLAAGVISGMVGIGGGTILVPAMVYILGFSQHQAQGTTLAMFLIPIGILGVYNYWKGGYVDVKTALIMAITFVAGSYFGSKISISLEAETVKKIFGIFLAVLSVKMIFFK
jgi:uncharacterized membrane protein YfcA